MTPSHQHLSINTVTHHHLTTHPIQHHQIKSEMRKYSERQQLIQDLFFLYVHHYTNYMDDQILPISQSRQKRPQLQQDESQFFFHCQPLLRKVYDSLYGDLNKILDLLHLALSQQYLNGRSNPTPREQFDLASLFNMSNNDFCQSARTTKEGFIQVLSNI
ncbi:hypothetical protein PCANC_08177 [Puccinia coronata f. sp. avenae]|uniref:Uncharacterized protein n=1 Tax=Puccinia coronata f. sp. avenae TaxID=200324 RepID=A0A2N5VJ86_9BASI|nr:hypothetical protein PCANC_08177 [Puccinia coronata f. sp. avenae]